MEMCFRSTAPSTIALALMINDDQKKHINDEWWTEETHLMINDDQKKHIND